MGTAEGAAAGLVMARKLDLYWSACGLLDEARHWLELALATGAGTPQERALAMAVAARFAVLQHDRRRARELVDEGTEVATAVDDARALGLLLVPAAMLAVWDGTPTAAAEQADAAVAAASETQPTCQASCWRSSWRGSATASPETVAQAAARHRQCIARADEVGERHMKALAVAGLGEHELAAGRLPEATALFGEAIILKRDLGDRMGIAVGLDSLGRVAIAEGRAERAALLLGAAEGIWDAVGMSETGNPFAFAPSRSDGLQQARGLLGKQRFRELFRQGSQLSLDEAVAFAVEAKDRRGSTPARARRAVPPDQARAGGGRPGRRRAVQPGDRRPTVHLRADRSGTRGEHPAQARVQLPVPDRRLGHRTPAGGGTSRGTLAAA